MTKVRGIGACGKAPEPVRNQASRYFGFVSGHRFSDAPLSAKMYAASALEGGPHRATPARFRAFIDEPSAYTSVASEADR